MQWYDRIRQVKFLLVVMAVVIAVGSLIVSHYLVRDLALGERRNMEVWAEAMRTLKMSKTTFYRRVQQAANRSAFENQA